MTGTRRSTDRRVGAPTELLPNPGGQWTPVDDRHARATCADGDTRVSLAVGFGADGLIESVRAEDCGRITRLEYAHA
jgi:hypothetical protein